LHRKPDWGKLGLLKLIHVRHRLTIYRTHAIEEEEMADENAETHQGDLTGKTLGQYEIGQQLGKGGMATVYLARQTSIGRTVALKIMPAYFMHDPSFLQRFEREVQVIARLQHPRILPVYDYGELEGRPYLVMAYMSGGTIADRIKEGQIPLGEVVRIVEQIAEGLDHAHRKGVIHRDFKPSNVLLDENGNAHLADFGIAKVSESTVQLTGSGIVGTPAYMAPEMANQGLVTPSIDIYALGITTYEMLTGKFPYQGDTPLRVMMAHATAPIPDVRELNPDCPLAVANVVRKAMAKDPDERYATAGEMAAALRAAAEGRAEPAPTGDATLLEGADSEATLLEPVTPMPPTEAPTEESPAAKWAAMPVPTPAPVTTPLPEKTAPPVAAQPAHERKGIAGCGISVVAAIVGVVALIALCGGGFFLLGGPDLLAPPTPTLTPSPTPTATPTSTPTPLPTSTPTPAPTSGDLWIENRSGVTICYFNISPNADTTWGEDDLGASETIIDGADYHFADVAPDVYDLRAVDCDQNTIDEIYSIDIGAAGYTWTISNTRLTVVNNSSFAVCSVYLSPASDTTWGANDMASGQSIAPGDRLTFSIEPGDWDMRADACDQDTYWENPNTEHVSDGTEFTWTLTD
jgi:serine/threonine protein kinase